MKIRIIVSVLLVALWGFLNRGVFYTVDQVAGQTLAVNTVNGGDGALLAQNAYHAAAPTISTLGTLAFLGLFVAIWFAPLSKLFSNNQETK
jgi:hypothetical protein